MTIRITDKAAVDIAQHVSLYVKPGINWSEVQVMRACDHGCKLYVRKQGAVLRYQLMHSAAYGCRLAHNPETAVVKVSVCPKTKGDTGLVVGLGAHAQSLTTQALLNARRSLDRLDTTQPAVRLSLDVVNSELAGRR